MINLAHIHPMLVHFPLALLPVALAAQMLAMYKGENLFSRHCLASSAVSLIFLAALSAIIAAVFGDMALDQAVAAGVPADLLETHEDLGQLSAILISTLSVFEIWFYFKQTTSISINWITLLAGMLVFAVVITTAWFGGHLVYDLGVNVTLPTLK